jgi:hypothetical protein
MYGMYPKSTEDPAYFRPFEFYEPFLRRLGAALHIHRQPRSYAPAYTQQQGDGEPVVFVGRPAIEAPRPLKAKGVLTLKFEDGLGHRSDAVMSVYYPGTVKVTKKRTASAGVSGDTFLIAPDAEVSAGTIYEQQVILKPVREDPVVSARLLTGTDLAEYLSDYLFSLVHAEQYEYAGGQSDEAESPTSPLGDIDNLLWRTIGNIQSEPADVLQMESDRQEITLKPDDEAELTISGSLGPSNRVTYAVEARTEGGAVVSDIVELRSDDEGRIFEI